MRLQSPVFKVQTTWRLGYDARENFSKRMYGLVARAGLYIASLGFHLFTVR